MLVGGSRREHAFDHVCTVSMSVDRRPPRDTRLRDAWACMWSLCALIDIVLVQPLARAT